jgi:hypothetical protein
MSKTSDEVIDYMNNDMKILRQAYNGNHLEEKELKRAFQILKMLEVELKTRCK